MKVCYISCYRDGTGYAYSAIAHMMALDAAGVDVVARAIKMTPRSVDVPDKVKEFEAKDLKDVDVVIQHNLPSEFSYKGGVLNVGAFAYETSGFPNANWNFTLGLMDKVLVSSNQQLDAVENTCGREVAKKTFVLPHPVDVSKFSQDHELMDFETDKNTVKFYTISEMVKRKNLAVLLLAYYSEFDHNDNVLLIVKTHLPGADSQETIAKFSSMADSIKSSLGRFKDQSYYPKVALVSDYLKEKHINSLHKTGDIFVSGSHGEAICLPLIDAIGFGKPVIVPAHSAFLDYTCDIDQDLMVPCQDSVVFGIEGAPKGLYTADETWWNVSPVQLGKKMRDAYKKIDTLRDEKKVELRKRYVENILSYEAVGQQFKEHLNAK